MEQTLWDVIVVGGGAAGMMAAGTAAEKGARVLVIEKNNTLGKKLLITGGGRCNVTNSQFDVRKFLEKYKENAKFLFSAFSQRGVSETLEFFHDNGMQTKVEDELRTFPISNSAQSVWNVLVENMKKYNVTILPNSPAAEILHEESTVTGVKLEDGKIINSKSIIIATGGTSRPETGSTGDGYAWLQKIGHTIIIPTPSLVPLVTKEKWVKEVSGVSLINIKITAFQNNQKQIAVKKGKILFTHVGVSGPTILNMSKDVGELLKYGEVIISLDLFPSEDHGTLDKRILALFREHDKKKLTNTITNLVPATLGPVILKICEINGDIPCNSVTREDRSKIVHILKDLRLEVDKLLGVEKAIITSGGVTLDEVDFKTMRSRLFPNLYLIGDILNVDRPSGGYSLQMCWTSGHVAGKFAAEK